MPDAPTVARSIMEQALEALVTRRQEVARSISSLEDHLAAAKMEVEQLDRAVKSQQQALERMDRLVRPKQGARTRRSAAKPREPGPSTNAGVVLALLRSSNGVPRTEAGGVTLGNIIRKTGMSSDAVRASLHSLVDRRFITRLAEGVYAAAPQEDKHQ